jgi:hypothetical protein
MAPDGPWKKPRPKTAGKTTLLPKYRALARAAARRAGRRYPNLIDNLHALRLQRAAQAPDTARARGAERPR